MRKPSTSVNPRNPQGILPPIGKRAETFAAIMRDAQDAFGKSIGMTCIDSERAFFQKIGDNTFYSVAITATERSCLGWMQS